MSDGAGVVTAVGDGVTAYSVGEKVLSYFFPKWGGGRPTLSDLIGVPVITLTACRANSDMRRRRSVACRPTWILMPPQP
ncbi:MAG: hypothetical protein CM15mP103_02670 [Gammaproteobacteria bacterium]|nr:MAG: hypothetical protein CM15mP103_02670 [Gammaproteobacteria bacterium]